ncbi:MAG: efflux RND transporter permease subunit [Planctomycetes bacterium]|nr:efflux RND transporter permease subunit [Planctomycetota bacterium]
MLRLRESDAERLSQELDRVLDNTRAMLPPDLSLSRRLSLELTPLVSQMADEIQQDQPPGLALQQQTSAGHGTVLVRRSPPRAGVAIVGPERAHLCKAGRDLADQLRKVPGVTDVQADSLEETPQKRFTIDRERAANLGMATSDIRTTVDVAQGGHRVGRLEEPGDGRAFDVVVSLAPEVQDDADTLQGLLLRTASGEAVALGQFVTAEAVSVPRSLYRQQMLPSIMISCEVRAGDRAQVIADIKRTVAAYPLPPGYRAEWE